MIRLASAAFLGLGDLAGFALARSGGTFCATAEPDLCENVCPDGDLTRRPWASLNSDGMAYPCCPLGMDLVAPPTRSANYRVSAWRSGTSEAVTSYVPGEKVTISFEVLDREYKYLGLLIYAYKIGGDILSKVGRFELPQGEDVKFWLTPDCQGKAVTHYDATIKHYIHRFHFVGPDVGTGRIRFRTMVKWGETQGGAFYWPEQDLELDEGAPSCGGANWIVSEVSQSCADACEAIGSTCDASSWDWAAQKQMPYQFSDGPLQHITCKETYLSNNGEPDCLTKGPLIMDTFGFCMYRTDGVCTSPLQADQPCTDVPPPASWLHNTCYAQKHHEPEMCEKRRTGELADGYCHASCGVCSQAEPVCTEVQPPGGSCAEQVKDFPENCDRRKAGELNDGYCSYSCGVCNTVPTPCSDTQPPAWWTHNTCEAQVRERQDLCEERRAGTLRDGHCYESCGVCSAAPTSNCTNTIPPTYWTHNTCEAQVQNRPDLCERRRAGTLDDGVCYESCGVCSPGTTPTTSTSTTTTTTSTTVSAPARGCTEIQPPAGWRWNNCADQVVNRPDNCEARRAGGESDDGFCHYTCGACSTTPTGCVDIEPPSHWHHNTCARQKEYRPDLCEGRRNGTWRDGYCYRSCGVCDIEANECTDIQPPSWWRHNTCAAQVANRPDLCELRRTGSLRDGYCHRSCQVCLDGGGNGGNGGNGRDDSCRYIAPNYKRLCACTRPVNTNCAGFEQPLVPGAPTPAPTPGASTPSPTSLYILGGAPRLAAPTMSVLMFWTLQRLPA